MAKWPLLRGFLPENTAKPSISATIATSAGSCWYSAPVASTPRPTLPTQFSTPVFSFSASRICCAESTKASVK